MKAYIAELVGTAILVIGGCGAAIFAGSSLGILGIAISFGLSLAIVAYLIGGISGGHVNPAVTIALALSGKFEWNKAFGYVVAQILGGIIGAVILYAVSSNLIGGDLLITSGFATNKLATGVNLVSGGIIEVVMTLILCLVVLATTRSTWSSVATPIAVGVALTLTNIIAIPFTNSSLNPARSIGVALVSNQNINQLWLFIVAPLLGAVLAYFIHIYVFGREHHTHNVCN